MHSGWGVGILLFFQAISAIDTAPASGLALQQCGIPECVCGPGHQKVVVKCLNSKWSRLPNPQTYSLSSQTEVLDMSGSAIQEMTVTMLSDYSNLKRLILKNNQIKIIDKKTLENQNSLTELDLRYNNIKTLPRGIFSQSKLKVLYLANNPFSCNDGNLLGEIKDLMGGAGSIEVFDGEMLRCAEPAAMKGKRIIDVLRLQGNTASASSGTLGTGGIAILTSGIAALLAASMVAIITLIKKSDSKGKYVSLSTIEDGSVEQNQTTSEAVVDKKEQEQSVAQRLQKLRRQSQGYPENDNTESDNEEQEQKQIDAQRLQKLRRQSQGYPENDNTESDNEEQEQIKIEAQRLQKLRRQSQGYPENDYKTSDDEDTQS